MQEYINEYAMHWYHTPTQLEKAGGVWMVRAGQNIAKPNYKVGPRSIVYYSLHFILEGEALFSQGDEDIALRKGDLFCLFPHQMYHYRFYRSDRPLQMFWLAFDGKQSASLLHHAGITHGTPFSRNRCSQEMLDLVERIRDLLPQEDKETLDLTLLLYQVFALLARNKHTASERMKGTRSESWLNKSIEFMDIHYTEGLMVEQVARYVGIERSHFTKTFTAHQGESPKQYLHRLKMERAAAMLESPDYSVTEIALSLSYPHLYSFTRAFRHYFGIPPIQFRKNKVFTETFCIGENKVESVFE